MKCPKCGAVLDDDSRFCKSCGAVVIETETEVPSIPGEEEKTENKIQPEIKKTDLPEKNEVREQKPVKIRNTKLIWFTVISLIIGTSFIIIGNNGVGALRGQMSHTTFGADFYTFSYNGIVDIYQELLKIEVAINWIIVAIGVVIDLNAFRSWIFQNRNYKTAG